MRLGAVFACVRLISDGIASLPVDGFRKVAGVSEDLGTPPLFANPSTMLSAYDWTVQLVSSLLLHGNGYGMITATDRGGWPTAIEWLNPMHMRCVQEGFRLRYEYDGNPVPTEQIVHIRGLVLPGEVVGVSVLSAAKQTFALGLGSERFGQDYFASDAVPSGILTTDKPLNDPDGSKATAVKEKFREAAQGRDVVILGDGTKYDPMRVHPEEAQFIETQRFSVTQVARYFGVPPEMIGSSSGSTLTYANTEQRAIDFVSYALRPWFTRIERAFSSLIPGQQFVRFNADVVLRTDLLSRYQAHEIGIRARFLLPDEARALEDLPPIPGGDKFPPSAAPPVATAP
jgi:HK97 family phage portal protein